MTKINHLYVHIPFCSSICNYCAFNKSIYNKKFGTKYIDVILTQLNKYELSNLSTIYVGGGTPTSIDYHPLDKLLTRLDAYLNENGEFTLEANIENLDNQMIELILKHRVNRLSLGIQSFNQEIIKYLNRHHDFEMAKKVIDKLHKLGFNNINFDLIYGIKNQTIKMIQDDLDKYLSLGVKHISTYLLQIEDHTILKLKNENTIDDDSIIKQYEFICDYLKNFNHYEISNFAISGYESKHNLCYWTNREYLGVGLSSSSYLNNERFTFTSSLKDYLNFDFNRYNVEKIFGNEYEFEYLMLHLRLKEGFNLQEYQYIFKKDFLSSYQEELKDLKKYLEIDENVRIKEQYFLQSNDILSSLLLNLDY
ncbi:MAG: radical SAM family heme chaperone HemW [Bacilli bacterium]|nr:radical SAM family heme chaperone HemW [Bacilli bacterium]